MAVQNLAVHCLVGASFIDRSVKTTLLGLRKAGYFNPSSVAITGVRSFTKPITFLTLDLEDRSRNVRTTQKVTISPLSQANVQTKCPSCGLCFVGNTPRLTTENLALIANGIKGIIPHRPFNFLLSSFSLCWVHLSKNTDIGHAFEALERFRTVNASEIHSLRAKNGEELPKNLTVLRRTFTKHPTRI